MKHHLRQEHREAPAHAKACHSTALLFMLPVLCFAGLASHITEYDLDNGLHVIIYVDSSAPVVSTHVWYRVGAYDEPLGKTGLSHMLEHMTFKHTDRYEPGQFDNIIQEVGGRKNGFTSTYYTGYFEDLASDRWELSLELEAARMSSCRFDEDEFQREHQVVTEEWRLGKNRPASELWQEFRCTAYLAHPHRTPLIGWDDDVRGYTTDAVAEWYREHYNPANAVLVIAGDVRVEEAKSLVAKHFGPLKGRRVKRIDCYNSEPVQNSERMITLRREVYAPAMLIGYHVPGIRDEDYYAGELVGWILLHGRTSRLYQKLVTETGLATWVGGGNTVSRDPGLLRLHVTPRSEEDIARIVELIDQEIDRLAAEPVTDRELAKVQNQMMADQVFAQDNVSGLARTLARSVITTGSWRFLERFPDEIAKVTKEEIRDFSERYLDPENRTVALLLASGNSGSASHTQFPGEELK